MIRIIIITVLGIEVNFPIFLAFQLPNSERCINTAQYPLALSRLSEVCTRTDLHLQRLPFFQLT